MIFFNDTWVSDAFVSVNDRGFLFGDGMFESVRAYNGKAFLLDRHLERFFASAEKLGIAVGKTRDELSSIVDESLRKNNLQSAYIRITISRGINVRGIDICADNRSTLLVSAAPFSGASLPDFMRTCLVRTRKIPKEALDPSIKSSNFLNNIMAKKEAKENGCSEGVMLSMSGHIAEGTISNVFWVKDKTLFTPEIGVGILPGITRALVLELAEEENIQVSEGCFYPDVLLQSDAVFLTNSLMGLMPAVFETERKPDEIVDVLSSKYRELTGE